MRKSDMRLERRKRRVRYALRQKANGRPRLTVYKSGKNIYAQIIDDVKAITVVSASSKEKGFSEKGSTVAGASLVGKNLAKKAVEAGVKEVVFDRSGYVYHGRVEALAEAARTGGLLF